MVFVVIMFYFQNINFLPSKHFVDAEFSLKIWLKKVDDKLLLLFQNSLLVLGYGFLIKALEDMYF